MMNPVKMRRFSGYLRHICNYYAENSKFIENRSQKLELKSNFRDLF